MRKQWSLFPKLLSSFGSLFLVGLMLVGVLPFSLVYLFEAWNLGVGSCRGRIMWRSSFVGTLWVIWKERNSRHFQDKATNEALLRDKIKHLVASWVYPLDSLRGLPVDMIQRNWKDVPTTSPDSGRSYSQMERSANSILFGFRLHASFVIVYFSYTV